MEEEVEDSVDEGKEKQCLKGEELMRVKRVEKGRDENEGRAEEEGMEDWKVIHIHIGVINKKGKWVESKKDVHRLTLTQRPYGQRRGETVGKWEEEWEWTKAWAIFETRKDVEKGIWD
ncbi:hypothetical protein CgunFtcFv8_019055 [Champsocephalus gunnari]|uniref:Uncharacterized protein n=1 Tax=Champsocephalus gunnari TaxID=52237 RepID=A0AAN8HNB7_CHAGU|nr:hypothetical protein CgunFtcFv8_019055 [Champsocephalus gunnari]